MSLSGSLLRSCGVLFFSFGCNTAAIAVQEPSGIDWASRFGVLLVDAEEAPLLIKTLPARRVAVREDGIVIRVSAAEAKARRKRGYRYLTDPPFKYIDPEIEDRLSSADPAVWWAGYKDEELVERIIRNLAQNYPEHTTLFEIGRTHRNRPILALRLASGLRPELRPAFLFNGGHHGNEPLSIEYALDVARTLLSATPARGNAAALSIPSAEARTYLKYMAEFQIWIVPLVNPDGLHTFWNHSQLAGRRNGRAQGVDLNRNYPFYWNSGIRGASSDAPGSVFYRGPAPGSEPETRAMMRLADERRFVVSLSYHTFATKVLVPYTTSGAMTSVPVTGWRFGSELVSAGRSNRPDKEYKAVRNLYPVDGTDQDWLAHAFGTLAFIVEGSYQTPDFPTGGRASIEGMRGLSLRSLSLYAEGPTIQVTVLDPSGLPARARVRRLDQAVMEGEAHETQARTGRFDFVLDGPGETVIQAVHLGREGFRAQTKVSCRSGICPVTIRLTGAMDPDQWVAQ
ncbi:MAG: hypothetical protein JNM27_08100 [Leptospirales bacterium]|nr:hypothetical protein [Leptospirales bacterium]